METQPTLAAALLVGIGGYETNEIVPRRDFAYFDARGVYEWLRMTVGLSPDAMTLVPDDEATRDRIVQECRRLAAQARTEDEILVYLAGAATGEEITQPEINHSAFDTAILASSGDPSAATSHTDLLDALGACPGHVTLILDCGHDGSQTLVRLPHDNITVLAASRDNEFAHEDEKRKQGIFTAALLEVLDGWKPDVTWGDVYLQVFGRVAGQHDQHPMLIGDGSRHVFGAGAAGEWSPALPVLASDARRLDVYASPALLIGSDGNTARAPTPLEQFLTLSRVDGPKVSFAKHVPGTLGGRSASQRAFSQAWLAGVQVLEVDRPDPATMPVTYLARRASRPGGS